MKTLPFTIVGGRVSCLILSGALQQLQAELKQAQLQVEKLDQAIREFGTSSVRMHPERFTR
jgi:hypothetical protein